MSHLLDVNFLLAGAWQSHADQAKARTWLETQTSFATCPISQLGFLRVSLSPGYRASFADSLAALEDITTRKGAQFIADNLPGVNVPPVTSYSDVTDAYLVALAKAHHFTSTGRSAARPGPRASPKIRCSRARRRRCWRSCNTGLGTRSSALIRFCIRHTPLMSRSSQAARRAD